VIESFPRIAPVSTALFRLLGAGVKASKVVHSAAVLDISSCDHCCRFSAAAQAAGVTGREGTQEHCIWEQDFSELCAGGIPEQTREGGLPAEVA
jgi:hypothetical protein